MRKEFKREILGSYTVISNKDNSKNVATFKDLNGKFRATKIKPIIRDELKIQKNKEKSMQNEFDRHIEHSYLTDYKLNERAVHKLETVEDVVLKQESVRIIIREIWKLPTPQNRRVYMNLIDGFSMAEIARIERRDKAAIKRSTDAGMNTLRKKLLKKLKNF